MNQHSGLHRVRIYIGIDDSFFTKQSKYAVLAFTILKDVQPVSAKISIIKVDGKEATDSAIKNVSGIINAGLNINAVFMDGVTFAGFNYIDPEVLSEKLNVRVFSIFRRRPNVEKIKNALANHFPDWEERWQVVGKIVSNVSPVRTKRGRLFLWPKASSTEINEYIDQLQIHSKIPEPLRIAEMTARAFSLYLFRHNMLGF